MTENFEIDTFYGKVSGTITIPGHDKKYPCVILSHGLISSRESSKYVALSDSLNTAGIASCRFDYHGCGESDGNIEETTLTKRVENLNSIMTYIVENNFVDPDKLGILGSSFGGSTCIIKAARDSRIKCIVLWATPYRLEEEDNGRISGIEFKKSIFTDFLTYNLLSEATRISCALVIHGEVDETVPCSEGKLIYKQLKKPKKLEVIKGADHIFSNLSHRQKAINLSLNWFRRYLLKN